MPEKIDPETPAELREEWRESETGETLEDMLPVAVQVTHPVRIEEFPARTIITDQVPVAGQAVRVMGEHRTRSRAVVTARGADVVIGNSAGLTLGTGYLLTVGTAHVVLASDALYAVSAGQATVHVYAELREG